MTQTLLHKNMDSFGPVYASSETEEKGTVIADNIRQTAMQLANHETLFLAQFRTNLERQAAPLAKNLLRLGKTVNLHFKGGDSRNWLADNYSKYHRINSPLPKDGFLICRAGKKKRRICIVVKSLTATSFLKSTDNVATTTLTDRLEQFIDAVISSEQALHYYFVFYRPDSWPREMEYAGLDRDNSRVFLTSPLTREWYILQPRTPLDWQEWKTLTPMCEQTVKNHCRDLLHRLSNRFPLPLAEISAELQLAPTIVPKLLTKICSEKSFPYRLDSKGSIDWLDPVEHIFKQLLPILKRAYKRDGEVILALPFSRLGDPDLLKKISNRYFSDDLILIGTTKDAPSGLYLRNPWKWLDRD